MNGTFFEVDLTALGVLTIGLLLAFLSRTFLLYPSLSPHFAFSDVRDLNQTSRRVQLAKLPQHLHHLALLCLLLAFIDPHFFIPRDSQSQPLHPPPRTEMPTEGIAIYLLLDQSGSMNQKIPSNESGRNRQSIAKIDLLKEVTKHFILNRPSDLIGIVPFARVPKVLSPLTLDQQALFDHLDQLEVVADPEEDGSSIGYAIFKTANLIAATRHFAQQLQGQGKAAYEIKNAIIIVITDGFQDPNRLDYGNRLRTMELDEAAIYAKNQGIRLYMINIDPLFFSAKEFAPHRRQMKALTEMTGGHFYSVNTKQGLQQVYDTIDELEKEAIPMISNPKDHLQATHRRLSFYPFLIALGLICLLSALFLESTCLKKIP